MMIAIFDFSPMPNHKIAMPRNAIGGTKRKKLKNGSTTAGRWSLAGDQGNRDGHGTANAHPTRIRK